MTEQPAPSLRCAIYTRKSTEEGLEQEFNTLQAQRESAEAYILSHRQAGWSAIAERYDDGGFSGASIDRPALRKLLAAVESGSIDCVLVYKVDRLSRSLLDFARLMEQFERHQVSFVSITQDFNTTSSLGRLTLNVLLSFAQFEREIIGERTRDKLSAARRKGKWIGGSPVLGYDVADKRLVVSQTEAAQVRQIYRTFLELDSLKTTVDTLRAQSVTTKAWTSKRGTIYPGKPFSATTLRRLLSNVLYAGSVSHKGTAYPGEQEALVEPQLWDAANEKLKANGELLRSGKKHDRQNALLARLLYCDQCQSVMFPTCTTRSGKAHRYYACRGKRSSGELQCQQLPVSAIDLESSLMQSLEPILGGSEISAPLVHRSVGRVTYDSSTRLVSTTFKDGTGFTYTLAWPSRAGVQRTVGESTTGGVPRMSRLMALAIKLERLIGDGAISNFRDAARLGGIAGARMGQIMKLTNLAPAIQEELLFLPRVLAGSDRFYERQLREIAQIMDWDEQKERFRVLIDTGKSKRG